MIGVVIAEADTQGSIVELAVAGDEVAFARRAAFGDVTSEQPSSV